jgi:hypothetical protein
MITRFNKYKLITEDPDHIYVDNNKGYNMSDKDAVPFVCIVNKKNTEVEKLYFGEYSTYHDNMNYDITGIKAYPGRIWLDSKIIAFWVYPKVKLFKLIINKIEENFDIQIFNNDWKMEVIKNEAGKLKKKKENDDLYINTGGYENAIVIPLDEYTGSEDVPKELQIQHLMNWKEKELARKLGKIHFGVFGSNLTAWDQPYNIRYRQAIRTSENNKL